MHLNDIRLDNSTNFYTITVTLNMHFTFTIAVVEPEMGSGLENPFIV